MNPKSNIVAAIKALGYNSRQVSVRKNPCSTEWSFDVTIRDPKVNMAAVGGAVKNHESIDRCQASGEILAGGNTYIHVKGTDEVKAEWAKPFIPMIEVAMGKISPENKNAEIMKGYSLHNEWANIYSIYHFNPGEVIGRRIAESNHIPGLALRMYFNEKAIEGL